MPSKGLQLDKKPNALQLDTSSLTLTAKDLEEAEDVDFGPNAGDMDPFLRSASFN